MPCRSYLQLADPLVDPYADGVAGLLANGLPQRRLDWEPVCPVTLRHQSAHERLTVDRTADLDKPSCTEELGHIADHHARPRTRVLALLKLRVELSQHGSSD